ncbi:ankyrin repeat protein [Megavirus baoshan]|uniref:Ankyrin repeat protein n=1 Tax=Megavirus baoshan TaxID=2496520 RepID=A0A8K1T2A9_9VIRU|nr:ankyrin repeat protein [Megavirus baoshan]UFX99757.1 ankyrin repeat protein [Megavirus baoshan]
MNNVIIIIMEDIYYKILGANFNQKGYQYHKGLNVLDKPFENNGSCVPGGLYFTNIENIFKFINYGVYLVKVTIPEDAQMVKDPDNDKWRADKIIISDEKDLREIDTIKYLIEQGADIKRDYHFVLDFTINNNLHKMLEYILTICKDIKINLSVPSVLPIYSTDMAKVLINHKAKLSTYFVNQIIEHYDLEIIKIIVKQDDPTGLIYYIYNMAVKINDLNIVKILYENNSEIKNMYELNSGVFKLALAQQSFNVLNFMIENNFKISVDIYAYIIDRKTDPNVKSYVVKNYNKIMQNDINYINYENRPNYKLL